MKNLFGVLPVRYPEKTKHASFFSLAAIENIGENADVKFSCAPLFPSQSPRDFVAPLPAHAEATSFMNAPLLAQKQMRAVKWWPWRHKTIQIFSSALRRPWSLITTANHRYLNKPFNKGFLINVKDCRLQLFQESEPSYIILDVLVAFFGGSFWICEVPVRITLLLLLKVICLILMKYSSTLDPYHMKKSSCGRFWQKMIFAGRVLCEPAFAEK